MVQVVDKLHIHMLVYVIICWSQLSCGQIVIELLVPVPYLSIAKYCDLVGVHSIRVESKPTDNR